METYLVKFIQTIEVEAKNKEEAEEKATDLFTNNVEIENMEIRVEKGI